MILYLFTYHLEYLKGVMKLKILKETTIYTCVVFMIIILIKVLFHSDDFALLFEKGVRTGLASMFIAFLSLFIACLLFVFSNRVIFNRNK